MRGNYIYIYIIDALVDIVLVVVSLRSHYIIDQCLFHSYHTNADIYLQRRLLKFSLGINQETSVAFWPIQKQLVVYWLMHKTVSGISGKALEKTAIWNNFL